MSTSNTQITTDTIVPGVYLSEVILKFKNGKEFRISYDPNSKIQATYNLSVLSEGLTFMLRTIDRNDKNSDLIKKLYDNLSESRVDLSDVGYIINNNGSSEEVYVPINLGSDVSYAKSLASEEVYIYTNRSDK